MSLKAIHICFILLSIALAVGFGCWAAQNQHLNWGIGAWAAASFLMIYLWRFIQKMKKISSLPFWFIGLVFSWPRNVLACSVCFGDPNSSLTKGAMAGVIVLLGVVGFVLGWIATLIFCWARKAHKLACLDPANQLD